MDESVVCNTLKAIRAGSLAVVVAAFLIVLLQLNALAETETRLVTDQTGRDILVPVNPVRVVALAPSVTEIVFALNREDILAGVTRFSNYPETAAALPSVGSYVHLDVERIVSLSPDLCIAIKDGNPLQVVQRIEAMGIPVFAIYPMNIDAVIRSIKDIGYLLNAEEEADRLVTDMARRLDRVDRMVSAVSQKPSVFFQIGVSPIVSAGSGTFIHELIERAGGRNAAAGHTGYPRFSKEEVLFLAPDVMILTSMERQKVFDGVIKEWREWQDLPAVRDDRIHMVNSDLYDRPSPRLIDGLEELVELLHPQISGNTSSSPGS
jgi:iron complex transport system substrate-binding protein